MNEFQKAYKEITGYEDYDEYLLYHEAGHAIMNFVLSQEPLGIKIDNGNLSGSALDLSPKN